MDAFAFEFMGLAIIALCLVVLALPSGRRPSRNIRYEWSGRNRSAVWPAAAHQACPAAKPAQKAVLCLKRRAKIRPKTLDIPALSAERLS
jgi:hypothetical protein